MEYHKCSNVDGLSLCSSLQKIIDLGDHSKGMHILNISHLDNDGVHTKAVGVYYRKNVEDSGIMLNYCPFCGGEIRYEAKK